MLTEEQRKFAEENHNLIYAFLHKNGIAANDYYDTAALGFLQAVQNYLTRPRLRRYAFATIAWQAMRREIAKGCRAELRQRNAERRYLETVWTGPIIGHELESQLVLDDIIAGASAEQRRLALLRLRGCSIAEAAQIEAMSTRQARRLLSGLYWAYVEKK